MKFSDELIADVARTLQIAILTGTDIVDHLRTFEVEDESGYIRLTKDSKERIEKEIKEMADRINDERNTTSQND
tara:strand:+ start:347 stop:568 length:222 start_codon:yes stop_codon:yes gene_type:complete